MQKKQKPQKLLTKQNKHTTSNWTSVVNWGIFAVILNENLGCPGRSRHHKDYYMIGVSIVHCLFWLIVVLLL